MRNDFHSNYYLAHHGILGMHWGDKNGPPYPLGSSDHSSSEKKAGYRKSLGGGRNEELYDRKNTQKADIAKKSATKETKPKKQHSESYKEYVKTKADEYKSKYALDSATAKKKAEENADLMKKIFIGAGVAVAATAGTAALLYAGRHYVGYTIKTGKTIQTLSRDPNRLKTGLLFYTNYLKSDKQIYVGMFGSTAKAKIQAKVTGDIKIPSNKQAQKIFEQVFRSPAGQAKLLALKEEIKYDYWNKAYANGLSNSLIAGKNTDAIIDKLSKGVMDYNHFNTHVLPLDGSSLRDAYVVKLNNMFREAIMKEGYGGVLDVNDTQNSFLRGFRPTILFDKSKVDISNAKITQMTSSELMKNAIPANVRAGALRLLDDNLGLAIYETTVAGLTTAGAADMAFEHKIKTDAQKSRFTGSGSSARTDMMIRDLTELTDEQYKSLHGMTKEAYKKTSIAYKKRMKASANNA